MTRSGKFVDHRAKVRNSREEVEGIIKLAHAQEDLIVQAHLMQLAAIRLSGFVEQAVREMITGYLEGKASPQVVRFSSRQVERLANNLNPDKLEQLVRGFDEACEEAVTAYFAKDENRQNLGNLIDARHRLAHGREARILPSLINDYERVAFELIDLLLDFFLPAKMGR